MAVAGCRGGETLYRTWRGRMLAISGPTVEECEMDLAGLPAGCDPAVGDVETCFEAFGAERCGFFVNPPPVCAMFTPACSGS